MLLGVILFTARCSDKCDKNWTRYLMKSERDKVKVRTRECKLGVNIYEILESLPYLRLL